MFTLSYLVCVNKLLFILKIFSYNKQLTRIGNIMANKSKKSKLIACKYDGRKLIDQDKKRRGF